MATILETTKKQIISAVAQTDAIGDTIRVFVSGGSVRGKALRSKIKELCKAHGVQSDPVMTENFKCSKSSETRGAAIGLQTLQQKRSNPEGVWNDEAQFLVDDRNREKTLLLKPNGEQYRLVCNPWFSKNADQGTTGPVINFRDCYDLSPAFAPHKSDWNLEVSLEGSGNDMELVMTHSWRGAKTVCIGDPNKTIQEACPEFAILPSPDSDGKQPTGRKRKSPGDEEISLQGAQAADQNGSGRRMKPQGSLRAVQFDPYAREI
ncbi:hypothetical protein B0T16DRAFT_394229 [Cercophora newfieldiana]|uniref:Uncharacterized protein n=1 Tax=Cercophora newfieldiana TaxID=92897 RepID=A0AA40CLQ0_9PEZI|nr:hypothetical protein B0T16DRAFT_394229 [Cercophora newfieldiana]